MKNLKPDLKKEWADLPRDEKSLNISDEKIQKNSASSKNKQLDK